MNFDKLVADANTLLWGPAMLILLFGTHLFLTFRLGFIQKHTFLGIRMSLSKDKEGSGDISQFGSLMTSLAATIGTGNIVGVATAIASGGPGAVLWIWLTGVFGIATKYGEAVLSVKFRQQNAKGEMCGGPMYVLEHGMKCRWLGMTFAALCAIASFGIGNMVQANSVAVLAHDAYHVPRWLTGLVLSALTAFVILGGIRSIARISEKLVPFMATSFMLGCIILLIINSKNVIPSLELIFKSAFTGQAAIGGFLGAGVKEAIRFGIARGLFSNESGMGSAPIVAAAAQTKNPVEQGLVSATSTFWDTVVMCAITGVAFVASGVWTQGLNGASLSKAAFDQIPVLGPFFLTMGVATFVFATIIGWEYYGEKSMEYLAGQKAVQPYRYAWVAAAFVGSIVSLSSVWNMADVLNGLMVIPNVLSLLVLNGIIAAETKAYFKGKT